MTDTVYLRDVENAQSKAMVAKENYLKRWGWVRTCNTPGAYWLWSREFAKYGRITADLELAYNMTRRSIDQQRNGE